MPAGVHATPSWRTRPAPFYLGMGILALWSCLSIRVGHAADAPALNPSSVLLKVQAAARQLDYAGVLTYQQGASMQSARLTHVVDGTGEREWLEILDGMPREYLRQNDSVQCLIPEKKTVIIEPSRADRFPGLLLGDAKKLDDHYDLRQHRGSNRIAGHMCTVYDIVPKDAYRYGYKLCIEPGTNLLLKTQTLNRRGEVVDQVAFSMLKLRDQVHVDQLASPWNTQGWKVVTSSTEPVDVAKLGWRVSAPPGFELLTQVSRPLKSGKSVKQLVYSDGLAAVSVFIETAAGRDEQAPHKGLAHNGAMNIFGSRIGDYWVTAIGEMPGQALRELVEHTEYVPLAAKQ